MPYGQAKEILNYAREFHRRVGEFYQKLSDKADSARVKMLLDYLVRHKAHLDKVLGQYEEDVQSRALDGWYQYSQDHCLFEPLNEAHYGPDMTVEDVMKIGRTLDQCLIASYKGMAEAATTAECREIFENLLLMEQQQKHKLARIALEINDM